MSLAIQNNDIEHDRRALVDSGRNVGFMESGPTDGREAVNFPLMPFFCRIMVAARYFLQLGGITDTTFAMSRNTAPVQT